METIWLELATEYLSQQESSWVDILITITIAFSPLAIGFYAVNRGAKLNQQTLNNMFFKEYKERKIERIKKSCTAFLNDLQEYKIVDTSTYALANDNFLSPEHQEARLNQQNIKMHMLTKCIVCRAALDKHSPIDSVLSEIREWISASTVPHKSTITKKEYLAYGLKSAERFGYLLGSTVEILQELDEYYERENYSHS